MDILFFDGHVVETMIQCYLKPERGRASPTMKPRFSLRSFIHGPDATFIFSVVGSLSVSDSKTF